MKKRWGLSFLIGIVLLLVFTGCTKSTSNDNNEKVTLKMLIAVDEEVFKNRFKDQIEEKFPNITLELMEGNPANSQDVQELLAKKEIPDIITVAPSLEYIEDLDLLAPIDDLIEKHEFDLSIFRDGIVEDLRAYDPLGKNQLYGLPIEISLTAMFYNKDIFDKLGKDYPTDNMTWDEVIDLARELTVERDGIQYKGLQILSWASNIPFRQLSVPGTDPETGEVIFADNPKTRQYFELLDALRSIPGMQATSEDYKDGFHTDAQNVAMWVSSVTYLPLMAPIEGFNFDLVTTPVWKDLPNIGPSAVALSFNITKQSEHKDEAFQVLSHLASPEGQLVLSRAGSPPTIKDEKVFEQFGGLVVEQYNKTYNTKAPFTQNLAPVPPYSKYDAGFNSFMFGKTNEFLKSDEDPVTFIRKIKEEYEKVVADLKGRE